MTTIEYQIASKFCEEALIELKIENEIPVWLKENQSLFESINIQPIGMPGIANCNYNGKWYEDISIFHSVYMQKLFEENILEEKSQYEAVVYFIRQMNIVKLNELLDPITYQDEPKYKFLELLEDAFCRFQGLGNTALYNLEGKCVGCNDGCTGFSFLGNNDESHMDLVIAEHNGRVSDIYDCSQFKCEKKLNIKKRIVLDKDNFPF